MVQTMGSRRDEDPNSMGEVQEVASGAQPIGIRFIYRSEIPMNVEDDLRKRLGDASDEYIKDLFTRLNNAITVGDIRSVLGQKGSDYYRDVVLAFPFLKKTNEKACEALLSDRRRMTERGTTDPIIPGYKARCTTLPSWPIRLPNTRRVPPAMSGTLSLLRNSLEGANRKQARARRGRGSGKDSAGQRSTATSQRFVAHVRWAAKLLRL